MNMIIGFFGLTLFTLFPDSLRAQSIPLILDEDRLLVEVKVNGIARLVNLSFRDKSVIFTSQNVLNNKKIDIATDDKVFESQLSKFVTFEQRAHCDTLSAGVLGNILQKNATYLIDFENNVLSILDYYDESELKSSGFIEIGSRFYRDKFEIVVNINWRDYAFIFDPLYLGTFSHAVDRKLLEKLVGGIRYQVLNSNSVSEILIFPFSKIYLNRVGYSSELKIGAELESRVGIGFIKGFTWIIDYQKKKIYYKKNSLPLTTNSITKEFKTEIKGGQIQIVEVMQNFKKYKLGSILESVNGKYVREENICELQSLLSTHNNANQIILKFK